MIVEEVGIAGVLLIKPKVFGDNRGCFLEMYNDKKYAEIGINLPFVQDNFSMSSYGVLRGLHFQREHPQGKLVSVSHGKVYDVAVDIRKNSPTFGKWFGTMLTAENRHQLWIEPGLAHGFVVLSEVAHFQYKCTDYYYPEYEVSIAYNDKDLNIDWQISNPILSDKDKNGISLVDWKNI